eukprot:scaffold6514_cov241-Prasinococcus_capsulatus_cf.AAC.1
MDQRSPGEKGHAADLYDPNEDSYTLTGPVPPPIHADAARGPALAPKLKKAREIQRPEIPGGGSDGGSRALPRPCGRARFLLRRGPSSWPPAFRPQGGPKGAALWKAGAGAARLAGRACAAGWGGARGRGARLSGVRTAPIAGQGAVGGSRRPLAGPTVPSLG